MSLARQRYLVDYFRLLWSMSAVLYVVELQLRLQTASPAPVRQTEPNWYSVCTNTCLIPPSDAGLGKWTLR